MPVPQCLRRRCRKAFENKSGTQSRNLLRAVCPLTDSGGFSDDHVGGDQVEVVWHRRESITITCSSIPAGTKCVVRKS